MPGRKAQNISYKSFLISPKKDISSHKLEVSQFQRNYVWQDSHVKSLINSIKFNDKGFYLGNIVIQRNSKGNSSNDYIVDGQQRLVTLSLVVNVLRVKLKLEKDKKLCDSILFFSNKTPRISFSRKTLNNAYLSILKDKPLTEYDENQLRFIKSYKVINSEINNISDKELFLSKILSLEFVVIKCSSSQSVYQLFESLNSNGQKLSPVELTKNALLGGTNLTQSKINAINAKWEKIEKSFEVKETRVIWFGKFLRHNWFSIEGYISENKLFERIKFKIKDNGVEDYSEGLLKDSDIYLSLRKSNIRKSDFSEEMSEVAWKKLEYLVKLIKELQLDQVYAVLLSLVKYGKKNNEYFKKDKFFIDINKLWSFLVLIKYSSKISPSSYEKLFANFCYDIHHKKNFKEIKNDFFKKLKEKVPNNNDFVKNINEKIKCTGVFQNRVNFKNNNEIFRIILLTYLSSGREILGDFTIEHIIPKGNLVNWKNISPKNRSQIENVDRFKLGNLTLLKSDNVANYSFNKKYDLAYRESDFVHNKDLKEYRSLFNSENPGKAVNERGKEVAKKLYKIYYNNL